MPLDDTRVCLGCEHILPIAEFQRPCADEPGDLCCNCSGKGTTKRGYDRKFRRRLRADVLAGYGGKCVCCGTTHVEFLTIDHVAGGGTRHRKLKGGHGVYVELRRLGYPAGYRIMCWNCNCSHGMHGYCPHKPEERSRKKAA